MALLDVQVNAGEHKKILVAQLKKEDLQRATALAECSKIQTRSGVGARAHSKSPSLLESSPWLKAASIDSCEGSCKSRIVRLNRL